MACLNGTPRTANVTALERGEVWEIRRNVLDRLMRLPSQRQRFESEYRESSLDLALQNTDLFNGIEQDEYRRIVDYLRQRLTFVRLQAGQTLFREGEIATRLYLVRLGHVRVGVQQHGKEAKIVTKGPGTILGEIGLLALSLDDERKTVGGNRPGLETQAGSGRRRLNRCPSTGAAQRDLLRVESTGVGAT